jgi:hypothetical protein
MPSRGRRAERTHPIVLRQDYEEGYPVGTYAIDGLQLEDLQRLADWAITLPRDQYNPLAEFHRAMERAVIEAQRRFG